MALDAIKEKIVAKRFGQALGDLDLLLAEDPDHIEALYMSAVCRRYRGEFEAALGLLAKLKSKAPDHGRAHQEEGYNYRSLGRPDRALIAFERACMLNPALEASWRARLGLLEQGGRMDQARRVKAELERLQATPRPLIAVMDLIAQGRLLRAEDLCREFLKRIPHHVEGMRLLADIGQRLGVLDDAEFLLDSALKFQPDNVGVRIDLIRVLRKRQKFQRALEQAEALLESSPEDPRFLSLYAIECMQTGDYATALETFDQVLARVPGDPVTLTAKGHAYKTSGQYQAAVDCYRAAIARHPRYGEAWYSLANLKVYRFGEDEVRRMRGHETDVNLSHHDRVYLCFALGKAQEDRGHYDAAFDYYRRGNRLKRAQSRYRADEMTADLRLLREVCTAELFDARAGQGHGAPDPIFIVGLPRAGSTLLEQILSSHSQVDGTLELPNIPSLSQRLRRQGRRDGSGYPEILAALPAEALCRFGERYVEETRIHRRGAPFFIDKMPNNFRHIGLIRLILPNAKVIDARREPMACCFSGFRQLFAEGQEFSYDLEDLGRYYRDYVELMDHWDRILPGFVLRVEYEDVVADLEAQVRRLLDYCGLPFEPACLEFHRTERNVRTPSSEQVRQPIYRRGLDAWRHFEEYLTPLREALGRAKHP